MTSLGCVSGLHRAEAGGTASCRLRRQSASLSHLAGPSMHKCRGLAARGPAGWLRLSAAQASPSPMVVALVAVAHTSVPQPANAAQQLVKGRVYGFDQLQGTLKILINTRMTVVVLSSGGLLVNNPVAPTKECQRLLQELVDAHGPVKYIALSTLALEHKTYYVPFARCFPEAELWVAPGQWSFPLNIPFESALWPRKLAPSAARPQASAAPGSGRAWERAGGGGHAREPEEGLVAGLLVCHLRGAQNTEDRAPYVRRIPLGRGLGAHFPLLRWEARRASNPAGTVFQPPAKGGPGMGRESEQVGLPESGAIDFEAPVSAGPRQFRAAFAFLEEEQREPSAAVAATPASLISAATRRLRRGLWNEAEEATFPEEELQCLRDLDADTVARGTSEPPVVYRGSSQ
eukprot:CAMPEP_0117689780 /NCGR_PEP_ID=MMETSP0804-20121206/24726_1 /TAXON_ID=1074897 /ORGANISM="Tetraselmis astigmatica, Strain CCMP880" /LENGTH=402 /DNA_ID=CAMNT_0005502683 /DNA_START=44 /DNA_END=1255 /DNA_ORIENTATION=+